MHFVGINNGLQSLKQMLLVFDRVCVPGLSVYLSDASYQDPMYTTLHEELMSRSLLEVLSEKGLIWGIDNDRPFAEARKEEEYLFYEKLADRLPETLDMLRTPTDLTVDIVRRSNDWLTFKLYDLHAIATKICLHKYYRMTACPLFSSELVNPFAYNSETATSRKASILNLVLDALPIPTPETAIESIVEFREDPASAKQYYRFRRWLSKVSQDDVSIPEIQDEYLYLLDEYTSHIRRHHIDVRWGKMKILVVAVAEIIEKFSKGDFAGAFGTSFGMREQERALLAHGDDLPGNELAYIYNVEQTYIERRSSTMASSRRPRGRG